MSILGLIGSLLGGFAGGGKRSERSRRESRSAQPQSTDRISQSTGGDQVKAKAAGKLALIKSGSKAGVLGDTPIGRKKLLGN